MTFLLLGLLAHVVAEFALQPDNVVESKGRCKLGGYLHHGATVFACSAVAFHLYGLGVGVLLAAAISVVHIVIDWLKNLVDRGASPARSLGVFVADQCAHVVVLIGAQELAHANVAHLSEGIVGFYTQVLFPTTTATLEVACAAFGVSLNRLLILVLAYVSVVFAGAVFVRRVLDAFSIGVEPRLATNAGRYIGMVERALMLTLVLVDALPSIAFVLTAKSLARFQELNDMRFAEYYLVGTLTSACVALGVGIVAGAVLPAL